MGLCCSTAREKDMDDRPPVLSTADTEFPIYLLHADFIRELQADHPVSLPQHQDLMKINPTPLKLFKVTPHRLFSGDFRYECLMVSHRWEQKRVPDPTGLQLRQVKRHLLQHPSIKWVWYDFWCLPQMCNGTRTIEEQEFFTQALESIYFVCLSFWVLILLDKQYEGRFWTCYETWLAMQEPCQKGVRPAVLGSERYKIVCIGAASGAAHETKAAVIAMWHHRTPEEACAVLAAPDILVTNKSEKHVQLGRLSYRQDIVQQVFALFVDSSDVFPAKRFVSDKTHTNFSFVKWDMDLCARRGRRVSTQPDPPKPQQVAWAVHQIYILGSHEKTFAGKLMLLDKEKYTSVEKAVDMIQRGTVSCESGLCVVLSREKMQYFLIYRSDKKEDALISLRTCKNAHILK